MGALYDMLQEAAQNAADYVNEVMQYLVKPMQLQPATVLYQSALEPRLFENIFGTDISNILYFANKDPKKKEKQNTLFPIPSIPPSDDKYKTPDGKTKRDRKREKNRPKTKDDMKKKTQ